MLRLYEMTGKTKEAATLRQQLEHAMVTDLFIIVA